MEDQKKRSPKYSPEVRERAVRMVFDHADQYPSQWEAMTSIAAKASPREGVDWLFGRDAAEMGAAS